MSPERRELDLMGAKVLGWELAPYDPDAPSEYILELDHLWVIYPWASSCDCVWSPSTDLNQAWEVAAKVGHTVRLEQERGGHAVATLWPGPPAYGQVTVRAETRPLALMKAVQAALSGGDQS